MKDQPYASGNTLNYSADGEGSGVEDGSAEGKGLGEGLWFLVSGAGWVAGAAGINCCLG